MSDHKFDQFISEIRNEQVDEQVVAQAGKRAWSAISGPASAVSMHKLRSCEDFQGLIPEYLGESLPEARRMLLEDHVHQCVACRHAVEQARAGEMQPVWRQQISLAASAERSFPVWNWAMGVVAAAIVVAGGLALVNGNFPGQNVVRASVQNVDGSLYAVSDDQVRVIPAGYQIRSGDTIRTAKGSNAVVRLLDGSLVEMSERSDLSVSREWRGTTIHLEGGKIIVQAAKQHNGGFMSQPTIAWSR